MLPGIYCWGLGDEVAELLRWPQQGFKMLTIDNGKAPRGFWTDLLHLS